MRRLHAWLPLVALVLATPAAAQSGPLAPLLAQAATATADSDLTEAEVRKVDRDARKVTLRHGPIPNLDMPEMTMVFRVRDPAMLDPLKPGDRIRIAAEKIGGQYTVTRIEPAR